MNVYILKIIKDRNAIGARLRVVENALEELRKNDDFKEENDMNKFKFRNEEVSYMCAWSDSDTFGFDFGDGEFTDSENMDYFIRFEYHVKEDEWIVEIWWENDSINIDELDKSDADDFITEQEIEEVKEFARQLIKE